MPFSVWIFSEFTCFDLIKITKLQLYDPHCYLCFDTFGHFSKRGLTFVLFFWSTQRVFLIILFCLSLTDALSHQSLRHVINYVVTCMCQCITHKKTFDRRCVNNLKISSIYTKTTRLNSTQILHYQ